MDDDRATLIGELLLTAVIAYCALIATAGVITICIAYVTLFVRDGR